MSMTHTFQSSYERMRLNFVIADDSAYTASTYVSGSRPTDCWQAGPEVGGVGIIFIGTGVANNTFGWELYGYRVASEDGVGPAEFIGSGTGALGTAEAEVGDLYADTIVITDPGSWLDVPVAIDVGNNRVCKVCFDLCGYKYVYVRFVDIGGGGAEATSMNAYIGYF